MRKRNTQSTLAIASNVKPALEQIVPLFQKALGPDIDKLQLGGGTVLASRWQHRTSTDLDFFLRGNNPTQVNTLLSAIRTAIKTHADTGSLTHVQIAGHHLSFRLQGTQTSIFTTPPLTSAPSIQRERSTNILLEPTEEILAKKLHGRIMGNGVFTKRDFYDFCIANLHEPEALSAVISNLGDGKEMIHAELKNKHDSEMIQEAENSAPLLNPAYPDIADQLWDRAARLFQNEPQPSQIPTGRDEPNYDYEL